jgi:hypothetical protein
MKDLTSKSPEDAAKYRFNTKTLGGSSEVPTFYYSILLSNDTMHTRYLILLLPIFHVTKNFQTIHRKCIQRIYGDRAEEIIQALAKDPLNNIPIVLRRLKQKVLPLFYGFILWI